MTQPIISLAIISLAIKTQPLKKIILLTLISFCISTSNKASVEDAINRGLTVIGAAAIATYIYSAWTFAQLSSKFGDERSYKNSAFSNFDSNQRLIAQWNENIWPTAHEILKNYNSQKQEFLDTLKKAFSGSYLTRYVGYQYFLRSTHYDIISELEMINEFRSSLLFIKKCAFGFGDLSQRWLEELERYEERLVCIQQIILGMPEYEEQVKDFDRRLLIAANNHQVTTYRVNY